MPRQFSYGGRRLAYWWNNDIADYRRDCFRKRRQYQEKRKRHATDMCEVELKAFRLAKSTFSNAIRRVKEKSWQDICSTIDKNPWGLPYRLVQAYSSLDRRH